MKINLTRTLAVISALLMCVQNISVHAGEIRSVVSEQSASANENLIKTGTCGENLTWSYDVLNMTLTISGSGAMPNYDTDKYPWSSYKSTEKIIIEQGVTSIGTNAFFDFHYLESVSLPEGLTRICKQAFYFCGVLTSVTLPESMKAIDSYAFALTALTSINTPDSLVSIDSYAFQSTPLIKNQTGIQYADKWVIGCDNTVTNAVLPEGIKGIAGRSFNNCTYLETISFPDSLEHIGGYAFYGCNHLNTEVVGGISYLNNWVIQTTYKNPVIRNGTVGISNNGIYGYGTVDIPESVVYIDYGAIYNRSLLEAVIIRNPDCVIEMSDDYSRTFCNDWYSDTEYYFTGTIYGEENSTAQAYAKKYNIKFLPLSQASSSGTEQETETETSSSAETSGSKGDINNDGQVNATDAAYILKYAAEVGSGKFEGSIEDYMLSVYGIG